MPRRSKAYSTSRSEWKDVSRHPDKTRSIPDKKSLKKKFTTDLSDAKRQDLPDLKKRLMECHMYDQYVQWHKQYISWRKGDAQGARGEATSSILNDSTWRDEYRQWRQGATKGPKGEAGVTPHQLLSHEASVFYDVIADPHGEPMLVPVDGPTVEGILVKDFPPDALVTVRVFRFFESRGDEKELWEKELRNLNSGSLLWLPVHLTPGMHSVSGAKYGQWFTIHYLQVYAKHFNSAYHMCNEGWSPAKSFGSAVESSVVKGEPLESGYYWFVSPAAPDKSSHEEQLQSWGWKHLAREGPFDGAKFVDEWRRRGAPVTTHNLQAVLDEIRK
jgi:hypothetical protein